MLDVACFCPEGLIQVCWKNASSSSLFCLSFTCSLCVYVCACTFNGEGVVLNSNTTVKETERKTDPGLRW